MDKLNFINTFVALTARRAAFVLCPFLCLALVFSSVPAAAAAPAPKEKAAIAKEAVKQDPFLPVIQKARKQAERSYKGAENQAPEFVRAINETQWNAIRPNPKTALWQNEKLPFTVTFYQPGFIYDHTVTINVVNKGESTELAFSPDMFLYGSNKALAEKVRQTSPGFAGLRLVHPLYGEGSSDVVASFLGATYFQGIGRHSQGGVRARALALNTAQADGEEFPYFREFWLVTPQPGDTSMTICALLDAPSMTGAYRFVITPGTSTVMEVEARIFLRKNSGWPQKIGIAPLTSMFLYAEADNGRVTDYRPEVHSSDGLLFSTSDENWTWVPLVNPPRLTINTFAMENPRGFGLMQRDAAFDHYQDIAKRYDRMASLWVEPQGDWGAGRIELIQIPSSEEYHDNITAFWVPDNLTPVEEGADPRAVSLAYKLYWMTPGVTPHPLGRATATRLVKSGDTARFYIDFDGEDLKNMPEDIGLTSLVETPDNTPITDKQLMKNPATGGWRLSFSVKLPRPDSMVQSIISTRDGSARLRFRALLKKGENLPAPLTEVWVYDLPL